MSASATTRLALFDLDNTLLTGDTDVLRMGIVFDKRSDLHSDSINDLPLLSAVANPVAVDPDLKLVREVAAREWSTIQFRRNT